MNHLDALELNLSNQRIRLSDAKSEHERALRAVWVGQLEREVAAERRFVSLSMTDDEILAELTSA